MLATLRALVLNDDKTLWSSLGLRRAACPTTAYGVQSTCSNERTSIRQSILRSKRVVCRRQREFARTGRTKRVQSA